MSLPTTSPFSLEQFQALGDQLQSLTRRVEQLEAQNGAQAPSPSADPALRDAVAKAAKFAEDIFRCPVQIGQDFDPELPETAWFDIWVEADLPHAELMKLRHQWYEKISDLELDDPTSIRLIVV